MEILLESCYSVTLPSDAAQQAENRIKEASISLKNWWHGVLGAQVSTKDVVLYSTHVPDVLEV